MGITPPEGMGVMDRICNKCLHKMYDEQIKQDSVKQLKKNMTKISREKSIPMERLLLT
jgi:hypothetical protein